jgi:hypothetical protein
MWPVFTPKGVLPNSAGWFIRVIGMYSPSCSTHASPSPRVSRRAEIPTDTGPTPPETKVTMTDTITPAVAGGGASTAISWFTPSMTRWVAYEGSTRVGSIDLAGRYIACNGHQDVIGVFESLSEAQGAIADPQPTEPVFLRRSRARRADRIPHRRHALVAVVAAAGRGTLAVVVSLISFHA